MKYYLIFSVEIHNYEFLNYKFKMQKFNDY